MGLQEEALRRRFSLDAGRSAQLALRMAQDGLEGRSSALVAIEDEKHLFVATTELDDSDIRNVNEGWSKSRGDLLAGQPVLHQRWVLLPVGHRAELRLRARPLRTARAGRGPGALRTA